MPLKNIKVIIAVVYVLAVAVGGLLSGVTSASGWVALAALAVLPAGAMLTLWNDPTTTMSESIRQARR